MSRDPETALKAKQRDGMECVKCGRSGSPSSLHAHHIVPRSSGGSDRIENLATLCPTCHRYAPTAGVRDEHLESLFGDYIETDLRPEADLLYFGQLRGERAGASAEETRRFFEESARKARESDDLREVTEPCAYWLQCAALADYGCTRAAMAAPTSLSLSQEVDPA